MTVIVADGQGSWLDWRVLLFQAFRITAPSAAIVVRNVLEKHTSLQMHAKGRISDQIGNASSKPPV